MQNENNEEVVLCIYDEKGVSIKDKILEVFEKYIMSSMQNVNF